MKNNYIKYKIISKIAKFRLLRVIFKLHLTIQPKRRPHRNRESYYVIFIIIKITFYINYIITYIINILRFQQIGKMSVDSRIKYRTPPLVVGSPTCLQNFGLATVHSRQNNYYANANKEFFNPIFFCSSFSARTTWILPHLASPASVSQCHNRSKSVFSQIELSIVS